jgi:hypothetical protein
VLEVEVCVVATLRERRRNVALEVGFGEAIALEEEAIDWGHRVFTFTLHSFDKESRKWASDLTLPERSDVGLFLQLSFLFSITFGRRYPALRQAASRRVCLKKDDGLDLGVKLILYAIASVVSTLEGEHL